MKLTKNELRLVYRENIKKYRHLKAQTDLRKESHVRKIIALNVRLSAYNAEIAKYALLLDGLKDQEVSE